MKTIDEVLLRMDEIVEECKKRSSSLGYFAVLYRMVTRRIREGWAIPAGQCDGSLIL
jgi:hypothetical protein